MIERHELGDVTVEVNDDARTVTSIWRDGVRLVAKPVYDAETVARAVSLGYVKSTPLGADMVWAMTKDHDLFHHVVAQAHGAPWSWHLKHVALGEPLDQAQGDREERMVLLLQRACNVGREGILK
jgi:hypothetical protein